MDYKYIISITRMTNDNKRTTTYIELDNLKRLSNVYKVITQKKIALTIVNGKTIYTSPYTRICSSDAPQPYGRVHIVYEYHLDEKTKEQLKKEKEEKEYEYDYVPFCPYCF